MTVTGTLNPDATGRYDYTGQYAGYNYYQRGSEDWYIWGFSPVWEWVISQEKGVYNGIAPSWLGPSLPLGPDGTYWPEVPATGTATVTIGAP